MEPRMSITEIAFRWGFNDMAHFSRAFHKQHGETASAYRVRFCSARADERSSIA